MEEIKLLKKLKTQIYLLAGNRIIIKRTCK